MKIDLKGKLDIVKMYLCTQYEVHGYNSSDLTEIITYPHAL